MSVASKRARAERRAEEHEEPEAIVDAIALVRRPGQLGHSTLYLQLPESAARHYAVRVDPPELKAVIMDRLARWLSEAP